MNEWSNDQAHAEGWQLHAPSGYIMAYGWEFVDKATELGDAVVEHVMEHITKQAQAGSAYHIEALARHYFRE